MEERSPDQPALAYRHIGHSVTEALSYIDGRRSGAIQVLQTPWPKLNRACSNGIEWHMLFTLVGMSGSGKSSIASQLETGLIELNTTQKIVVLSFNYEMMGSRVVGRKLSGHLGVPVQTLYNGGDRPVTDEELRRARDYANKLAELPIYHVDIPGTVAQMYRTIRQVYTEKCKPIGAGLVVFLDHTLLPKGGAGGSERILLVDLYRMFMQVKKQIKCTIFSLSQMNRSIEEPERINAKELHYPMKKDIFGSDAVYQASDYVMVTHKPALLNISAYGPQGLPVINPDKPEQYLIYWHLLKNRDGGVEIMRMVDNLRINRVDEYVPRSEMAV